MIMVQSKCFLIKPPITKMVEVLGKDNNIILFFGFYTFIATFCVPYE